MADIENDKPEREGDPGGQSGGEASSAVMERKLTVEQKLESLPHAPGVYLFKDEHGEIIYVGKALSLRGRVRSYFTAGEDGRVFYSALVSRIKDFDYVVTNTEKEALILENNFIKQFKPKFNLRLADDKSYIVLAIDTTEPYPRVQLPVGKRRAEMSKIQKEGARQNGIIYFGPYTSSVAARETIRLLNRIFPLRKCKNVEMQRHNRPCLHQQMGENCGYCAGMDEESYRKMLDQVILVLNGKYDEVLQRLREHMMQEAKEQHFERAAQLRDQICAIERTFEKQMITSISSPDRDIFGMHRAPGAMEVLVMFVRDGKLGDFASFTFNLQHVADPAGLSADDVFASFIKQFYGQKRFIPKEVLIPVPTDEADLLASYLSDLKGEKVDVICPQRGEKKSLIDLAACNAENSYRAKVSKQESTERLLDVLQQRLHLRSKPERIECFDISNIQGRLAVGAMVTFDHGTPNKARYRRFKIRTVTQSDDFAMMKEVLTRHLVKTREENQLPNLIMVDGGKGQLGVATEVLGDLAIESVDVAGIAKTRLKARPGQIEKIRIGERIFVPGKPDPFVLHPSSPELLLMQRVRDEAHRFAIRFHKELRRKKLIVDPLAGIPGVGPARRKALMAHFKDLGKIRDAAVDEIAAVKGISLELARAIHDHLHPEQPHPSKTDAAPDSNTSSNSSNSSNSNSGGSNSNSGPGGGANSSAGATGVGLRQCPPPISGRATMPPASDNKVPPHAAATVMRAGATITARTASWPSPSPKPAGRSRSCSPGL